MSAKVALGLLPPSAEATDALYIAGQSMLGRPDTVRRTMRGSQIGYVPKDPLSSFNPTLRVSSQIARRRNFHRSSASCANVINATEMLRRVSIRNPRLRTTQYPYEMSDEISDRHLMPAFAYYFNLS